MKPGPTNADRAARARAGVLAYVREYDDPENDELRYWVQDILTDLRHLCDSEGLSFDELDRVAEMHYDEETEEELSQEAP